jgi:two-component system, chemotaxis family, sensor kinase CheA
VSDELDMSAYRDLFASESAEHIDAIVDALLKVEADPGDLEPVEAIFRAAHSLKGMAGAMGYARTADLTHRMETLMDAVRRRTIAVDGSLTDLLLRSTDTLRDLVADEMAGRVDVDPAIAIRELEAHVSERGPVSPAEREPPLAAAPAPSGLLRVTVTLDSECALKSVRAYMVVKRLGQLGEVIETRPSAEDIEEERFDDSFEAIVRTAQAAEKVAEAVLGISEVTAATVSPEAPQEAEAPVKAAEAVEGVPRRPERRSVRIGVAHLDSMVDLVGELVIARSRLETLAARHEDRELADALDVLHRISSELQQEVMAARMVPVRNAFNRFPRMVRDLARELGKEVAFRMEGLDIELDRTVLDEVADPLVHLLRNALDHGVEDAGGRTRTGKPAAGTIRLLAERERDRVLITVSDDGRGMDVERIWRKAVERGLVAPSERDEYDDDEVLVLTCRPGFSTADTPTQVSGRGVGLDVVRSKVERLGGTMTIRSRPGEGCAFVLSLPLTLAIIQSLLVRCAGEVYAIPLASVAEVLDHDDLPVETMGGAPVVTRRDGRVMPLLRLSALLRVSDDATGSPRRGEHLVIVEAGESACALVVDALVGRQEIVIKSLAPVFRDIRGLAGATVLGDGSVALILDPHQLFVTREVV